MEWEGAMKRLNFAVLALLLGAGCGSETTPLPVAEQAASTAPQVANAEPASEPQQPLEELLSQAKKQLEARDANAAVQTLTKAIQQHPKAAQPSFKH